MALSPTAAAAQTGAALIPYIPAQPAPAPELSFNDRQVAIIRSLVAKDCNEDELALFLEVCRATGLNPLFKQIYAIVRGKDDKKRSFTIQTGIDGYRLLAARTGTLAGIDDATFDVDTAEPWHPTAAHVTVWRFVMGQRVPFSATARWSEYAQRDRDGNFTGMWPKDKMPFGQLAKCAEALALRKACPAELSGIYTGEEMAQAENPPLPYMPYVDATPEPQQPSRTAPAPAPAPAPASDAPRPAPQPARQAASKPTPKPTPKPALKPAAPASPAAAQSPWKAMVDPDVAVLLKAMGYQTRPAGTAALGALKAYYEAYGGAANPGLVWDRAHVLGELRERVRLGQDLTDVIEDEAQREDQDGDEWTATPAGENDPAGQPHDLGSLDTGAPGN